MLTVSEMGAGLATERSTAEGWNWQVAPAGSPEPDRVTIPAKEPKPETDNDTGGVTLPGIALTLAGEGGLRLKSTMCRVREKSSMSALGSEPMAWRLKT